MRNNNNCVNMNNINIERGIHIFFNKTNYKSNFVTIYFSLEEHLSRCPNAIFIRQKLHFVELVVGTAECRLRYPNIIFQ